MSRSLFCWLLRWFIGTGHVDSRASQPSWLTNRLNILVTLPSLNLLVKSFTKTFKSYSVEYGTIMLPVVVVVVGGGGDDEDDDDDDKDDDGDDNDEDDDDDDDYDDDDDDDDYDDNFNASLMFCLLFFLLDFV
jgi:hypothetical protein